MPIADCRDAKGWLNLILRRWICGDIRLIRAIMFNVNLKYTELSFIRWRTISEYKDEVAVGWSRYCFDIHYLYSFQFEGVV